MQKLDGPLEELRTAKINLDSARSEWQESVKNLSDACPVREGDIVTINTDGYSLWCSFEGHKMKITRAYWMTNSMVTGWRGWKLIGHILKANGEPGKRRGEGFLRYTDA